LGAGTEKIEEEAANLFPNARIARLDSDTSQNQKSIIKDFEEGRTDILIGTQMIGKGFDFSNLTVVAIIAADGMLGIQDFRADESAFQLMKQFRGRCGRREKKGLFIIQTSQPEHPLYQNLSGADMADYNDKLLLERKDFGFPPYSRILEISVRDNFEDRAERMAYSLAKKLSQFNVTGPYSPPVDKIADLFIRKIRICLPKDRTLSEKKGMIKGIVSEFEKERKYPDHIVIDVDPS
jgi:primosomal protein N' (replication factor Y)